MNKPPRKSSLTDGVRNRLQRSSRPTTPQRRISRRESEAQKQRLFYIGIASVVVVIALILGAGALWEYQIKPNAVLATVNGHEIKRKDYWKYQAVSYYATATQYENFAMQVTGTQQQQYLQFAASYRQQSEDTWGSTDVNDVMLQRMVEDRLYLDGAKEMGIDPSDADVETYMLNTFASADEPLVTPIPSPTMIPERAAAATETAEAALGATPVASPAASPVASPIAPEATPATPVADYDTLVASAESGFKGFQESVLKDAHLSRDDYKELFARPQLVRELVDAKIVYDVPQSGEQIHLEHILVATEDLATELYSKATGGASFEELAKANSTDTITAPTGGDLGWVAQGQMVPAFNDAAFALQPGEISQPVQTEFGWHIIKMLDRDEDRPYTDGQYNALTSAALTSWLDTQRAEADIDSDHDVIPTETPGTFEAPPDAPTPIPATPIPTEPQGTPAFIGPELPQATPVSPSGTPEAGGTPAATPVVAASPVASPEADATPAASPGA